MKAARRRVLLIGATGVFGERLARRLATWPDVELILAARRRAPLEALATDLGGARALVFDRNDPDALTDLAPFAVIDCAGPFQGSDYRLPLATLAAGACYLDIADGRAFVAGFPDAVDASARRAGLAAVTGCSSTPALTHAALNVLTAGWSRIDDVESAISPGANAPRGAAVIDAILSWAGRPVRIFEGGAWRERPGWSRPRRMHFPGVGRRWTALAETPDLDLLPARFHPQRSAVFRAGVASPVLHLGLWLLTWPVRCRLIPSLRPFAGMLARLAGLFAGLGSDRGGMQVRVTGAGPDGERRVARWTLAAADGAGPNVPVAPATALLRRLIDDAPPLAGAQACIGLVDLNAIVAELPRDRFTYTLRSARPDRSALLPAVLGEGFDRLPEAVRAVHAGATSAVWSGVASARRGRGLAGAVAALQGLPASGRYGDFEVAITVEGNAERWERRFGGARFCSVLSRDHDPLQFRERLGPLAFVFDPQVTASGFRWRLTGWRLAGAPLPLALAPRVRALSHARDGVYRFNVVVALPILGLLCGYAGRLTQGDPR